MTRGSADAYIRRHYGTQTAPVIAAHLGDGWTDARVRVRAQRMGIQRRRDVKAARKLKEPASPRRWTELQRRQFDELREMGENYKTIAREIRLSPVQVLREIRIKAESAASTPPALPARPTVEVRHALEGRLHEHALTSHGIRCACGRMGNPVHCDRHSALLRARASA